MKTNKAPEKIYLYTSDIPDQEYEAEWGCQPWDESSVEYTRTDAFIEKAVEWVEKYLFEIGYPDDWLRDSPNIKNGKTRFIQAMKGENKL